MRPVWRLADAAQTLGDPSEVVIAMPDGVIFQQELARQRCSGIQRHRRGPCQILISESTDGGGCRSAVTQQKAQCLFLRDRGIVQGVPGVHCVDIGHGHAQNGLSPGQLSRQFDFEGIDACHVVDKHSDSSPISRQMGVPLGVRQRKSEVRQGLGTMFQARR